MTPRGIPRGLRSSWIGAPRNERQAPDGSVDAGRTAEHDHRMAADRKPRGPIDVHCPCCGALLVVDPDTRTILRHEPPPKAAAASFDEMLKEVKLAKQRRDSKLQRAMEEQDKREEILEKKFREAMKKADSDDEPPPPRPIDLD